MSPPRRPAGTSGAVARSLADDVRARSDADLVSLLAIRPDLTRPRPADLTALAARAGTAASLSRAVDALDGGLLAVLEALVVAGDPVDLDWAAELLGLTPHALAAPLAELWRRGLTWRGEDGVHVPRAAADAVGPHVAGLAPATQDGAEPVDRAAVAAAAEALAAATDEERVIVQRLAWGPPIGTVASQEWGERLEPLLSAGLLQRRGPGEVILPRAAALALRGGRLHRSVELEPPPTPVREVAIDRVDAAAGAAAADLLAMMDELAALWGPEPPRVLRSRGLAVADLRATAEALDLEVPHAAFVIEVAYAAGLVDDDGALDPVWAPTAAYDDWHQAEAPHRWLELAQAWLVTTRAPALVGRRRDPKTPAVNALSEAAVTAAGRAVRHDLLVLLAGVEPGGAPDETAVLDRLRWARPRRAAEVLGDLARAALAEARWLGITGYGALSSAGRALLADAAAEEIQAALTLPLPVEHVLLQADLTAVAPGRLEGRLAAFLRLAADVESRGGATVYRFTPASLRRPLDVGWDAQQLLDALAGASSTGVPQPLSYLVTDVARRHGGLRVGTAGAYVRSDDHVAIDDLVERRDLAPYRLRRLAPGVAVAPVAPNVLVSALRDAGLLPVAEGPEGGTVLPTPAHHRARTRRGRPAQPGFARPAAAAGGAGAAGGSADAIEATVAALRAGEEDLRRAQAHREGLAREPLRELDPASLAAALRDAAAAERMVWIAVVDAAGTPRRVRLRPERVAGGRVYGEVDAGPGRSFSLHRISAVGPAL